MKKNLKSQLLLLGLAGSTFFSTTPVFAETSVESVQKDNPFESVESKESGEKKEEKKEDSSVKNPFDEKKDEEKTKEYASEEKPKEEKKGPFAFFSTPTATIVIVIGGVAILGALSLMKKKKEREQ